MSSSRKPSAGINLQKKSNSTEPSFGILVPPRLENPDELRTLAEWGRLPEIVSVPNAVAFLARVCNQNHAALLKIIVQAINANEIRFWGLSHSNGWTEGMVRFFYAHVGKPRIRPSTETRPGEVTYELDKNGRIHIEAMGINPLDAINLLKNRGRKVPSELLSLLPTEQQKNERKTIADDSISNLRSIVNTTKKRIHLLATEITQAQKNAIDPTDVHNVWSELVKLAKNKVGCLRGVTEDGIQYLDKNDEMQIFKIRNLRDRMRER